MKPGVINEEDEQQYDMDGNPMKNPVLNDKALTGAAKDPNAGVRSDGTLLVPPNEQYGTEYTSPSLKNLMQAK